MRASTIVLTCLTAASTASAAWLGVRLNEELADNEVLRADLQAQQRLLRSLPLPTDVAPPHRPAASQPPEEAPPTSKVPSPVESMADAVPPGTRARDFGETRRQLFGNPEYRKAMHTQQRMMIEQRYRDMPKALGLSPDKANQVFDLMAESNMQNFEGRERRLVTQSDGSQMFVDQNRSREDAALAKVLGTEGMQQLQDYRESMMSRSEVRQLGNELVGSSDPLRGDQMDPLFDLIYIEQKRLQQEWNEIATSGVDGAKMSSKRSEAAIAANQRILDSASSVLSGAQLAALKEMYRRQKAQMESQDEMTRLTQEAMSKPTPGRID